VKDDFAAWIGRTDVARDVLTAETVRRFCATLDAPEGDLAPGVAAPLGIHWCLAPPVEPGARLGRDGHPALGGFLPPIDLPRRMWAGGALIFVAPLRIGDAVERRSRIENIEMKQGKSGPLCFVTLQHAYWGNGALALEERHDIVYRAYSPTTPANGTPEAGHWRKIIAADPVLLFRYSAITFNGHRIHYDRQFCVEQENYTGLVVHGPLQATLLMRYAEEIAGTPVKQFWFRATAPVFDGGEISLNARPDSEGLALWTADQEGRPAMRAEARF
jgi:3-methylfumaryl-CoA hydratase